MEIGDKVLVRGQIIDKKKIVDITWTEPNTDEVRSEENIYFVIWAWRTESEIWR